MPATTEEQRLAAIRRRIDDLETRARTGTAESKLELRRAYYALLDGVEDATDVLEQKMEPVAWTLTQLELRLEDTVLQAASEFAGDGAELHERVAAALDDLEQRIRDARGTRD
jgi:hypothetical protein